MFFFWFVSSPSLFSFFLLECVISMPWCVYRWITWWYYSSVLCHKHWTVNIFPSHLFFLSFRFAVYCFFSLFVFLSPINNSPDASLRFRLNNILFVDFKCHTLKRNGNSMAIALKFFASCQNSIAVCTFDRCCSSSSIGTSHLVVFIATVHLHRRSSFASSSSSFSCSCQWYLKYKLFDS